MGICSMRDGVQLQYGKCSIHCFGLSLLSLSYFIEETHLIAGSMPMNYKLCYHSY